MTTITLYGQELNPTPRMRKLIYFSYLPGMFIFGLYVNWLTLRAISSWLNVSLTSALLLLIVLSLEMEFTGGYTMALVPKFARLPLRIALSMLTGYYLWKAGETVNIALLAVYVVNYCVTPVRQWYVAMRARRAERERRIAEELLVLGYGKHDDQTKP